MLRKIAFITFVLINILLSSCHNKNKAYQIDSRIQNQVEQKVKTSKRLNIGSMDFRLYQNDSLIADTYSKGKSTDYMSMSILNGDTASIIGYLGMTAGFGFQIDLFKDTCIVQHFAKSDSKIYKLNKSDSLTHFGISVPCKSYKLTLVEKPHIKKGEIISGIIQLESDEYFEVINDRTNKYKVELKAYFKTNPLRPLDENLKKYTKN